MNRQIFARLSDVYLGFFILIAALIIRVAYIMYLDTSNPIHSDASTYVQYAHNLLEHGVFSKSTSSPPLPDTYWAPLYPVFLVGSIKLSDVLDVNTYFVVLYLQAFFGALVCGLAYLVARASLSVPYAFIAAALIVLSPHLITYGGYVSEENLFSLMLLSAVYFYIKAKNVNGKFAYFAVSGAFFGLCYLVTPASIVVPIFLIVVHVYRYKNIKVSMKPVLIFSAAVMLFMCAWQTREVLNVPQSQNVSSDSAFFNFVLGTHRDLPHSEKENPVDPQNSADLSFTQYGNDHIGFYTAFLHQVVQHPLDYLTWYLVEKPLVLWGWGLNDNDNDTVINLADSSMFNRTAFGIALWAIMKNLHYWLLVLVLLGTFFAIRESENSRRAIVVIYFSLFSMSAVYILFQARSNFSVPLLPEFYICVAYALSKLMTIYLAYRKSYRRKRNLN